MRHPDQVVAALEARHPDWAIRFGEFSHEFMAFPVWIGHAHRQIISARNPHQLERAMAHVEAASGRLGHSSSEPTASAHITAARLLRPHR
jgi:hypothetical protein